MSRTHYVFTTVELSDETLHHLKKIQVSVPIAYEILQPYYQKRFKDTNVKVSLKSLGNSRTLVSLNPKDLFVARGPSYGWVLCAVNSGGRVRHITIYFSNMYPEWNRKLLQVEQIDKKL